MKQKLTPMAIFCMATLPLLSGCMSKDYYEGPDNTDKGLLEQFFNFATTNEVNVNIDYAISAQVLFEIYDQNPCTFVDDHFTKLADMTPIGMGLTNDKGQFSGKLTLPASSGEVYIYSPNLVAARVLKGTITAGILTVKSTDMATSPVTKAAVVMTRVLAALPAGVRTLAENGTTHTWDAKGYPLMEYYTQMNSNDYDIAAATVSAVFLEEKAPTNYLMGKDYNTDLIAKGENNTIAISFIYGYTGSSSALAYYCYPSDVTPTEEYLAGLPKCIIFGNAQPEASWIGELKRSSTTGFLPGGTQAHIKYLNPDGTFGNEWPEGTKIGFVLYSAAFNGGNFNKAIYSTPLRASAYRIGDKDKYSAYGLTSTLTYFPNPNNLDDFRVVLGFEDWFDAPAWGGKWDYNDVTFEVRGVQPTIEIQETVEDVTSSTKGLLAFEDNWPKQGDYDMNDMIVRYTSTQKYLKRITTAAGQKTTTTTYTKNCIVDELELIWAGAQYRNGFGYEVTLDNDADIDNITIARNGDAAKKADVVSEGDNKYIIYVFNDARDELRLGNTTPEDMPGMSIQKVTYTITIPYAQAVIKSIPGYGTKIGPSANPFLYVNKNRSYEIHLIDHAPTSKGTVSTPLFGSDNDSSNGVSTYYRAKDYYPYAIHLNADGNNAGIWDLDLTPERVEIYTTYPKFNDWAKGNTTLQWWVK